MLKHLDNFYFSLPEPEQSCFLFIRKFMLDYSPKITEHWKFSTAFFYYEGKQLCYFAFNAKTKKTYIGFICNNKYKHPKLLSEGRTLVKVFYIAADKDVDIKSLTEILELAIVPKPTKKTT